MCCWAANVPHLPTWLANHLAVTRSKGFSYGQWNVLVDSRTHTLPDTWWPETGIRDSQRQMISLLIFLCTDQVLLRAYNLNHVIMTSADLQIPGV